MSNKIDYIYDRYGAPRLRLLEDGRFTNNNGANLGFLSDDAVYNYQGSQTGWFEGGVLRDLNGAVLGFGEEPTDTPLPYLPYKQYKPYYAAPSFKPYRPYLGYKRFKPYKQFAWSDLDLENFFEGSSDE